MLQQEVVSCSEVSADASPRLLLTGTTYRSIVTEGPPSATCSFSRSAQISDCRLGATSTLLDEDASSSGLPAERTSPSPKVLFIYCQVITKVLKPRGAAYLFFILLPFSHDADLFRNLGITKSVVM